MNLGHSGLNKTQTRRYYFKVAPKQNKFISIRNVHNDSISIYLKKTFYFALNRTSGHSSTQLEFDGKEKQPRIGDFRAFETKVNKQIKNTVFRKLRINFIITKKR